MKVEEFLSVFNAMHKCLTCGKPCDCDQPFCSDACKSDDYKEIERKEYV